MVENHINNNVYHRNVCDGIMQMSEIVNGGQSNLNKIAFYLLVKQIANNFPYIGMHDLSNQIEISYSRK